MTSFYVSLIATFVTMVLKAVIKNPTLKAQVKDAMLAVAAAITSAYASDAADAATKLAALEHHSKTE